MSLLRRGTEEREGTVKRSKAGIVVVIIGVVLLILCPIFKWGIAPAFIKLPDDLKIKSVYQGTTKMYVDPATLAILPADQPVVVPIVISREDASVPSKSSSGVALVKETTKVVGPAGKVFNDYTHYYALERTTAKSVSGHNSDMNRTGWTLQWPFGSGKQTYPVWDDDTGKTSPAKFVKVSKISGLKLKDVTVYVYHVDSEFPFLKPPLGLPDKLTGAQVKALLGNPNLALSDTEAFPITYIKRIVATVAVEPETGTVADISDNTETYSVDASAIGMGNIKVAEIHYAQTPLNVANNVDDTKNYLDQISLATMWIPLILLIVGVVLVIIGGVLLLRKKPA